jgi:hypothetical protein
VAAIVSQQQTSGYDLGINTMPVLIVPSGQALVAVSGYGNFTEAPIPTYASGLITGSGDSPLVIYQPSSGTEWEMWQASDSSGWSMSDGYEATNLSSSTGAFPATGGYGLAASGLSYLGLIISESDIASGAINHALALEVSYEQYLQWPPASRADSGLTNTANAPAEGMWFYLPADVSMPGGMAPLAQMVFKALQTYGALVTDVTQGGGVYFVIEDPADWAAQGGTGTDPITTALAGNPTYSVLQPLPLSSLVQIIPPRTGSSPGTAPGQPTGVTLTPSDSGVPSTGELGVTWTAPGTGTPILQYVVAYRAFGSTDWHVVQPNPTTTSATITGLTNGTTYQVQVWAQNTVTLTGSAIVPASSAVPGVPGAPTGLTAAPGNALVNLSWTAPSSSGSSPIQEYDIYIGATEQDLENLYSNDDNGSGLIGAEPAPGTVYTWDIGLTNGTTYYFAVAASNSQGTGPLSNIVTAVPVA